MDAFERARQRQYARGDQDDGRDRRRGAAGGRSAERPDIAPINEAEIWASRLVENLTTACNVEQLRGRLVRLVSRHLLRDLEAAIFDRVMERVAETLRSGELRIVDREIQGKKAHRLAWFESGDGVGKEEAKDLLMELLWDRITDLIVNLKSRRTK